MESNGGARVSSTEVIKRYTTYVIRSRHLTLMMVSIIFLETVGTDLPFLPFKWTFAVGQTRGNILQTR